MRRVNCLKAVMLLMALMLASSPVFAQVDTSAQSLGNAQDWIMGWITPGSILIIIAAAIAWMCNLIRMDWAVKITVAMIVIGSAPYIANFFGIG